MAHHKSAVKRIRQTERRNAQNKINKSKTKSIMKSMREALTSKDKNLAKEVLLKAQSQLAKLAKTGVIKKNTAARTTSRIVKQVNSL